MIWTGQKRCGTPMTKIHVRTNKFNPDTVPLHEKKYCAKKMNERRNRINLLLMTFPVWVLNIFLINDKDLLRIIFYIITIFQIYLIIWLILFRCPFCNHRLKRIRGLPTYKCWYCGLPLNYQCRECEEQSGNSSNSD